MYLVKINEDEVTTTYHEFGNKNAAEAFYLEAYAMGQDAEIYECVSMVK
jgi:hypothetical protein